MLFFSAIIFIITFFFIVFRRPKATYNSPTSPPRLPLIGNLHQLGSSPHRSLQALSMKYGPLMLLHIGHVPTVVVSSPEMACEVMKKHDLFVASRPRSSMAKMLMYDCDLVFAPYGEYWRQVRKICVVHLLSFKIVQSFRSVREEEVTVMVRKIRASQRNLVNLSELIIALTSDIISRVALGRKFGDDGVGAACKVRDMLGELGKLLGSFPIRDFIPWLGWLDHVSGLNYRARKNFEELDEFLEGVLEEHVQDRRDASNNHEENRDFVDLLLSLGERKESVGISLGRDNIEAIILDMFAAGTDTTYITLEWAMAELIRNPKVMKRAQEEVRELVGRNQEIRDEDIDKMTYLKAIIKETLRLRTPVPLLVPRETIDDIKLEGFHIRKGTRVIVNAWAIGRDPSSWESPEEFVPERFLRSNVDFKGQDFQFIPFGTGRRICPGAGFAVATIELTLAHLLHSFDWELPKGMEEEVLDMSESFGITMRKKSRLVLVAKHRFV